MAQILKYKGALYQRVDNGGYIQEAQEALAILHGARSAITNEIDSIIAKTEFELQKLK